MYKFRSMKIETPNIATNDFTNSHVYITKIGKIIRKTSIDEIPQLFNILKGDMSIVGPRPVILEEVDLIELRQSYNIDKILLPLLSMRRYHYEYSPICGNTSKLQRNC